MNSPSLMKNKNKSFKEIANISQPFNRQISDKKKYIYL